MTEIDIDQLLRFDVAVPRYTSYPTAPEWGPLPEGAYRNHLEKLGENEKPIALYFHIPFCKTMCLYCGCSVILNRKVENEEKYVDYLLQEMALVASYFPNRKKVRQLHFGGGTPTKLSEKLFERLFQGIQHYFDIDFSGEVAIEIDPRTVVEDGARKLEFYRTLGFNRVSFGVQDIDPKVQEAVRRYQSYEVTAKTYSQARSLGFEGINIDLIYGLPFQTLESFSNTVDKVIKMRPDRIALFSYAKIPWLKPHQKAIREETLPSTTEKFGIYVQARRKFIEAGYIAIGMDHFALKNDEMATAFEKKKLKRNFQGYTVLDVEDLVSFGVTAIGYVEEGYFQNVKELSSYYEMLDQGTLPTLRGKQLDSEDLLRKWVIGRLMCDFTVDKKQFFELFNKEFDVYFQDRLEALRLFENEELVVNNQEKLTATRTGQLFIRNITSTFDWYLQQKEGKKQFSRAI